MGRVLNHTIDRNDWTRAHWRTFCVAALLCLVLPGASAETIKKSFPTSATPSFLIHNHTGKVAITGWDQNEITVQSQAASDAMDVIIMGTEQKVSVQVHPKRERLSAQEARLDFQIQVPRQATVRVDSERGEIVVENLEGNLTIEGVSTAVSLAKLKGHISVRTVDGPIQIRSSDGLIKADSISGDLRFVQVNGSELIGTTNTGSIRYEGDFGDGGTDCRREWDGRTGCSR